MHTLILASVQNSFCAATPGEPLRGTTETLEGGRQKVYFISTASHRAADLVLVADLPVTREEVGAAVRRSMEAAFPRWGGDAELAREVESEAVQLLDFAAGLAVGSVMRVQGDRYVAEGPTPKSVRLARELGPVGEGFIRVLTR